MQIVAAVPKLIQILPRAISEICIHSKGNETKGHKLKVSIM